MNETKPINQPAQGKNGKNKSGIAATVGAAAAAGVGGAAAAYAATRNDEDVKPEEKPEDTAQPEQEAAAAGEQHQPSAQSQPQAQPQQQAAPQAQPSASASTESQPQASSDVPTNEDPEGPEQGLGNEENTDPENPQNQQTAQNQQTDNNTTSGEQPIINGEPNDLPPENPDEIAEAIIAEEMIDPNDIDMADVINFDEIGTVYNVNGEANTVVSFHDDQGNHLTMIDIDGDGVLDVLGNEDGEAFQDENGDLVALGTGTTVGDAEIEINDDDTYLAADDNNLEDFGADSLAEDMLG